MSHEDKRHSLVRILRLAYSGERAAAYAYRGHWKSVTDPGERSRIKAIEEEEWQHRELVGEMLGKLGSGPERWREAKASIIGRTLGLLCHLSGWLAPMYGAGRLESGNVKEYEAAARLARDCDRAEFIDCLLAMAEVEWEHEKYFRAQVLKHSMARYIPIWRAPPPKEAIRVSFVREGA
jgi:rubrerythrin